MEKTFEMDQFKIKAEELLVEISQINVATSQTLERIEANVYA